MKGYRLLSSIVTPGTPPSPIYNSSGVCVCVCGVSGETLIGAKSSSIFRITRISLNCSANVSVAYLSNKSPLDLEEILE